jgi:uncharacterized protein
LLTTGKLITGGGLSFILEELVASGFVEKIEPYDKKKKESLFRLVDEFSLFYLRFMQRNKSMNDWLSISKTPKYVSWSSRAL